MKLREPPEPSTAKQAIILWDDSPNMTQDTEV